METHTSCGAVSPFRVAALAATLSLAGSASAQPLEISRAESRVSSPAPAQTFTGVARIDRLFESLHGTDASGGLVAFEPGARTAWHVHPGGQTLVITAGTGRVQRWGEAVQEVRAGDVVRIPPGQKHWHGAAPRSAMTHLAITEPRDGSVVQWLEQVSDDQYQSTPSPQVATPPPNQPSPVARRPSGELQQRLAPGLASLTDDVLYGDVWQRTALSPRDRSLVTIAALIATGRTAQLAGHLTRGLENGLLPRETSGTLAHLAIYSGWPNAVSALSVYEQVYAARKVDVSGLLTASSAPAASGDASRTPAVDASVAAAAPKFAQLTTDVVLGDVWRRTDLAIRDRSLVTIAALASQGDHEQLEPYLRRGLQSGLTRAEIAEAFTHLAFYAGWGKAGQALTVLARTTDR
jgi:4-carboxymuconolactone decarboxylase